MIKASSLWSMLCAEHCSGALCYITVLHRLHCDPVRQILLGTVIPLYKWGNRGTARLRNLPELVRDRVRIQTQAAWCQSLGSFPFAPQHLPIQECNLLD